MALTWGRDGVVKDWNPTVAAVTWISGSASKVLATAPAGEGRRRESSRLGETLLFKQRRFVDHEDLVRQLYEWLEDVNRVRPSRATGVPPLARLAEERPPAPALKIAPGNLACASPSVSGADGRCAARHAGVSMPPDALGLPGTLYLYRARVRIVGDLSAEHERLWEPGAVSTLPEHRAQAVGAVSGKRARRYLQRQHLLELGPVALAYLTELIHRRRARGCPTSSGSISCWKRTGTRSCAPLSSVASPSRRLVRGPHPLHRRGA